MVRQGIEAAWKVDGDELRWYTTRLDDVQARYQQALSEGAEVVIGPPDPSGTAAIAPLVMMPTLALNTPPANPVPGASPRCIWRQRLTPAAVAQAMHHAGSVFPMLMVGSDPLSQRRRRRGRRPGWSYVTAAASTLRWPAEAGTLAAAA